MVVRAILRVRRLPIARADHPQSPSGILEDICRRAGNFRFATMEAQHVAKLRDEKAAYPEAANNRIKALRQLFAWATSPEYRYATKNPARDVGKLRSRNPDGIRAWSEADAARYEARHPIGTKARLAFDLLLFTGVRRSDVVRLGPQMERDGKLVFTETKGSARTVKAHELPILPPLRQSIDATQTGHLVYLVTAWGRPHSVKAFGNWFKKRCREAGLEGLSAHGLRKLGAQRCAEAGASEHQLMALFGWTNPQQAAVYTKKANRAKLEASAAPLLEAQAATRKIHVAGAAQGHETATKVSHFLPECRPVGHLGRKSHNYQWSFSSVRAPTRPRALQPSLAHPLPGFDEPVRYEIGFPPARGRRRRRRTAGSRRRRQAICA